MYVQLFADVFDIGAHRFDGDVMFVGDHFITQVIHQVQANLLFFVR
jgi:hypothetical protein